MGDKGWQSTLRRHLMPVGVLLIIGALWCIDSLKMSDAPGVHAESPPAQLDLRDREVRIDLLIQDYRCLDQMQGLASTSQQPELRTARAVILREIREELAGRSATGQTAGRPLGNSVGIPEGTVIHSAPVTCWCRWQMLTSEPPKYRLEKKCDICKAKERAP